MKKKIGIVLGIILVVMIIAGSITNYVDAGRVGTGHEPKYCVKVVSHDGSKVTYWGLGYKVIRYVGVSSNEPYESNIGVKMGNWLMKYELPKSNDGAEMEYEEQMITTTDTKDIEATKNIKEDIVKMEISVMDENNPEGIFYTEPVVCENKSEIDNILSIINSATLYPDEEFDREYGAGDYFESCPELVLYSAEGNKYTLLACDNFDENLNIFYVSEVEDFSVKKLYKTDDNLASKIERLYNEFYIDKNGKNN